MIETPELFLAKSCNSLQEANKPGTPFGPGFAKLGFLCELVAGCCQFEPGAAADRSGLHFVDGPPDPMMDEGFQLFQIDDRIVFFLGHLDKDEQHLLLSNWRQLLRNRLPGKPTEELAELNSSLDSLVGLAGHAFDSGQGIFVKVLFR